MIESLSGSDLLNELAHEFAERYRRGERPPVNEYTERYPDLAGEIRDLFPTLVMMEQFGSGVENRSGPVARRPRVDEPMPERLGDYRIVREIGRGGMGIVYEAVQESLGRQVALKVLSQHRQPGAIQLLRFEREAKAAALLHHTNIVPVFGVGEHQGVHYYAMQYIEGQSMDTVLAEIHRLRAESCPVGDLSQGEAHGNSASLAKGLLSHRLLALRTPPEPRRSRQSPPPQVVVSADLPIQAPDRGPSLADLSSSTSTILGTSEAHYFRSVARLGMQVAEALGHAHLHGVLHRDIKPANLLLDLRGTVWVTDFGLAKAEGSDELTDPGDVVGTLRYMAPERFHGKADARSDIYSLGLTLYEMLTFAPAYTGSHRAEFIHAILHEEPERPRGKDPLIPRDLETIVLKAIAKNPSDRFSTADELARELGRFVVGRPILSRRVSLPERVWRWSRRNRMTASLILLAASLTSILAIVSTLAAWKFREQRDAVLAEEQKTRASLDRATTAERKREGELGRSLLGQARAMRYSGQPGRRSDALSTLARAAGIAHAVKAPPQQVAELRDEVIAALALVDDHPEKTWSDLPPLDAFIVYSVEADRYVVLGLDGLIHVHRLSDRSEARVLGAKRLARRFWPVFVPGGRFVLVLSDPSSFELWDLERGELPVVWPAGVRCVAARADGAQVAALLSTGELRVYDLPSLALRSSCPLGFEVQTWLSHAWMSLSQSGRRLALIRSHEKVAKIFDAESGRVVREIKMPTSRVGRALALNRNGGLLAIAHDRAISVFDMADGEQLALLQGHQSEGIFTWFQPGGDLLASSAWDGTTRIWDPIRGRLLVTLEGGFTEWLDGGSSLVLCRNRELIKNQIAVGPERRAIDYRMLGDRPGAALYGPARVSYSPDGRLLAMAARPEGVRIARAADGIGLALLPIGYCDEVLFMPSGDLLTSNERGLCRWPVKPIGGRGLRIGPPEPLAALGDERGAVNRGLATSADGHVVGASSLFGRGSILLDPDHPWRRKLLIPHRNAADLAISPDGRWACSGSRGGADDRRQVKVWDASTGKLVVQLPLGPARVAFSPDSRWLGVGGEANYRFFRTGAWTPGPAIEHGEYVAGLPLTFHPSSTLAAVLDSSLSIVSIVDVENGDVVAKLDAPEQSQIYYLAFSPDGRYLAAAQSDQRVDLWDLSSIRRRLKELGLAEGLPDIFDRGTKPSEPPPIDHIEVHGADAFGLRLLSARHTLTRCWHNFRLFLEPRLTDPEELLQRGNRWNILGHDQLAAADFRASLVVRPDSAETANGLAWCLARVPGSRDPLEAVAWARKAVKLEPETATYHNTLGVALYRAGHFAEATGVLERDLSRNSDDVGNDWLFLAMCNKRLGQDAPARAALTHAREWRAGATRISPTQSTEFQAFMREALSLLVGPLPDHLPADVFSPK